MVEMRHRIASLDLNAVANYTFDLDSVGTLMGGFVLANEELVKLLWKRSRPSKSTFRTPPGQTTVPANPDYSGGSTSSSDSKPEKYTQNFTLSFFNATLRAVRRFLMPQLFWLKEDHRDLITMYRPYLTSR